MIVPTRGKYLCEPVSREERTPSGLWMVEGRQIVKKDNVCRCLGVGPQALRDCYTCFEKKSCHKRCKGHLKPLPILAKRGDIIHYRYPWGDKIRWEGKTYLFLRHDDIIAVQPIPGGEIVAVGNMVILKLSYSEKMNNIIVPDSAKQNSGEYWGEVVSVGPSFMDQSLKKGDRVMYMRNEGWKFRTYPGKEVMFAVREKWIGAKLPNLS